MPCATAKQTQQEMGSALCGCVGAHLDRLSRNGGHVVGQAELGGFRRTGNTHSHCRHDARGVHPEWTDPSSRCNVGSRIAYIGKLPEEML